MLLSGVRQRTVRQQSTMDTAGTFPIYLYGNISADEEYHYLEDSLPEAIRDVTFSEHPDDLEDRGSASTTTRSGRVSKQRLDGDSVYH